MTLIAIPIRAKSLPLLQKKVKAASAKADIIEVWLDQLPAATTSAQIKKITGKSIIIVNKPKREKGDWTGSEAARVNRLKEFVNGQAAYVDIGLNTDVRFINELIKCKKKGTKIIVSFHDFKKTPSEEQLWKLIKKGFALGADVVKIATYANSYGDSLKILNILNRAQKKKLNLVAMCMGKYGKITRVMGPILGSYLSFVALDGKTKTAPGQLTIDEYKKIIALVN